MAMPVPWACQLCPICSDAKRSRGGSFMSRTAKAFRLLEADWPEFGWADRPPTVEASELEQRLDALRARMAGQRFTHAVIYADREHFANMAYLTNFDPRFEEALLV